MLGSTACARAGGVCVHAFVCAVLYKPAAAWRRQHRPGLGRGRLGMYNSSRPRARGVGLQRMQCTNSASIRAPHVEPPPACMRWTCVAVVVGAACSPAVLWPRHQGRVVACVGCMPGPAPPCVGQRQNTSVSTRTCWRTPRQPLPVAAASVFARVCTGSCLCAGMWWLHVHKVDARCVHADVAAVVHSGSSSVAWPALAG